MSFVGDIPGNQNIERVLLKLQSHQTFNLCAQNDSYHEFCTQMASYIVYIHVYPVYIKGIPGKTFIAQVLWVRSSFRSSNTLLNYWNTEEWLIY